MKSYRNAVALDFGADVSVTVVNLVSKDLLVASLSLFLCLLRLLLAGLDLEAERGVTKHF